MAEVAEHLTTSVEAFDHRGKPTTSKAGRATGLWNADRHAQVLLDRPVNLREWAFGLFLSVAVLMVLSCALSFLGIGQWLCGLVAVSASALVYGSAPAPGTLHVASEMLLGHSASVMTSPCRSPALERPRHLARRGREAVRLPR